MNSLVRAASARTARRRGVGALAATAAIVLLTPRVARAHFSVDYPDAGSNPGPSPIPWWHQDTLGSPQKLGPCGDEDDSADAGGGPTYVVTPFEAGQTITLQWTEIISHTGWYRIAIAADRNTFVDPPVEVDMSGNSADAGVENPPVLPVLADGIYPHTAGAGKTWPPYSLTLPNTPCPKCTIQIIQVMLDHPSNLGNLPDGAPNPDGFLYHHCIDVSISAPDGAGGPGSGSGSGPGSGSGSGSGSGGGTDAGGTSEQPGAAPPSSSGGCGVSGMSSGAPAFAGLAGLFGFVAIVRRRRASKSR